MRYKVKKGFIAYQFGEPTYCIGIERQALKKYGTYDCVIGKEEKKIRVSYDDALELINKYGQDKILRKNIFVIPVRDFDKGNNGT